MNSRISELTNGVEGSTAAIRRLGRMLDSYLAAVEAGMVIDPLMLRRGTRRSPRACGRFCRYCGWPSRSKPAADADTAIKVSTLSSWATSASYVWSAGAAWGSSSKPSRSRSAATWR